MATKNPDRPVRLLHLSDIHFRAGNTWDSDPVLRHLVQFIAGEVKRGLEPDLVVITGDLAHAGKAEEYSLARAWLKDELWSVLSLDPSNALPPDRLLLVPGNHDVDRDAVDFVTEAAQTALLSGGDQGRIAKVFGDTSQRAVLLKRHSGYLDFYADWLGEPQPLPWWQRRIEISGQQLHIAGLDSAWMACGEQDRGRLLLGRLQLNQTVDTREAAAADWRIALMHHPWDYLAEFDLHESRQSIHLHRDLVLRGHLHEGEAAFVRPPDPTRGCLELAAGCVYDGSRFANAFQWIELHPEPRRVRVLFRLWNKGAWQIDRNQSGCPDGEGMFDLAPGPGDGPDLSPRAKPESTRTKRRSAGSRSAPARKKTKSEPPVANGPPRDGATAAAVRGSRRKRCDVLLLYVNDKERAAIVEAFTGPRGRLPKPVTVHGLPCLDMGKIGGRRILATATNMGSATAGGSATLTHDYIVKLNPEWIIAVGVAFGMDPDKVSIGTVLVSDRVSCYEPQRVGRHKTIYRGDTVSVHPYLKQQLQTVSAPPYWTGAPIRFGEILSGEKLIDEPGFKGKLRKAYPEAIGGEMEAAGIYSAAMLERRDWIVVKAVCDFADGNKGEDKNAHQALAASNAAHFVKHVLSVYDADQGTLPDTDAVRGSELRTPATGNGPGPYTSKVKKTRLGSSAVDQAPEPSRPAETVHQQAVAAITESLDSVPDFRVALGEQSAVIGAATAEEIAARLCAAPDGDFLAAMAAVEDALPVAQRRLRQVHEDVKALRDSALEILGWMAVTTVLDGYDREDALPGELWFDGVAFHIPLGRNPCIEVLTACWRGGQARFSTEPERYDYGPDDITPKGFGEIGFDNPNRLDHDRAVAYILRRVYKMVYPGLDSNKLSAAKINELHAWLNAQRRKHQRRLRLVVDRDDLDNAYHFTDTLAAIHAAVPQIHLIVIDSGTTTDPGVFVLPPSDLMIGIVDCLKVIEATK